METLPGHTGANCDESSNLMTTHTAAISLRYHGTENAMTTHTHRTKTAIPKPTHPNACSRTRHRNEPRASASGLLLDPLGCHWPLVCQCK